MTAIQFMQRVLRYPSLTQLARNPRVIARAATLVKYYYYFVPVMALLFIRTWTIPLAQQNFVPLWPLAWARDTSLSPDTTMAVIQVCLFAVSIAGAFLYRRRLVRIAVFVAIWQAHAFMSSFGQPSHSWYPWLYTSLIFIFLPDAPEGSTENDSQRNTLLVIWWAQATFMLMYTMAGFWKFEVAFQQLFQGQVNGFSEYAFAYQLINWLPLSHHETLLGPFIINHPAVGWPFYVASHFFQLFALWTMIRPSLQRVWMWELITFHIMTYLTLGINFFPFIPLVFLLFYNSPFIPEHFSFKKMVFDLPVIGQIADWYYLHNKVVK